MEKVQLGTRGLKNEGGNTQYQESLDGIYLIIYHKEKLQKSLKLCSDENHKKVLKAHTCFLE